MDLLGHHTEGRHDTDPVVGGRTWARHGVSGFVQTFKRFCISLLARMVRTTELNARRPTTVVLGARFVQSTALGGRRPLTTTLTGRRVLTTALGARTGEC